jgi:hypothetical protein
MFGAEKVFIFDPTCAVESKIIEAIDGTIALMSQPLSVRVSFPVL